MTNFSNLKVKREKSNLKYTESKLVKKEHAKRKKYLKRQLSYRCHAEKGITQKGNTQRGNAEKVITQRANTQKRITQRGITQRANTQKDITQRGNTQKGINAKRQHAKRHRKKGNLQKGHHVISLRRIQALLSLVHTATPS